MTPFLLLDVAPIPSGGTALSILLVIVALIVLFFSIVALIIGFVLMSRRKQAIATQTNPALTTQAEPRKA